MTAEQEIQRLRDLLTHAQDNARCLETRRFIARGLRLLEAEKSGETLVETQGAGDRRT